MRSLNHRETGVKNATRARAHTHTHVHIYIYIHVFCGKYVNRTNHNNI